MTMHFHRPCVRGKTRWLITRTDRDKDRVGQQKQKSGVSAIEGAIGYKIAKRKKGDN